MRRDFIHHGTDWPFFFFFFLKIFLTVLAPISIINFLLNNPNQKKEVAPVFIVASMQWNAQLYLFMYFKFVLWIVVTLSVIPVLFCFF